MDRISQFWDAVGALTYAEMIEVCAHLRDASIDNEGDMNNAGHWASILDYARSGFDLREAA